MTGLLVIANLLSAKCEAMM